MSHGLSAQEIHERRLQVDRVRAQALVDLAEGRVSVNDVLLRATTTDGRGLMKVTVQQLLLSVPGVGRATVKRILGRLGTLTMSPLPAPRGLTLQWLLDGRSAGTRVVALGDAVLAVDSNLRLDRREGTLTPPPSLALSSPWDGFPFSPPPPRTTLRLSDRLARTGS